MICKICGSESKRIFNKKILSKYLIDYFYCNNCGFLQTEDPYWLEEAYNESITKSDIGYLSRNINLSKKISIILNLLFNRKKIFLDYAGGYGVFVRLMRDRGYDFYWQDKYTNNIFAKGFEYYKGSNVESITSFESFEHFTNPLDELENMLNISRNIIFTTELINEKKINTEEWWYWGLDHGQHISFYSMKTLQHIANKYNLFYFNCNNLHIFTDKRILFTTKIILKLFFYFHLYKILLIHPKSKIKEDFLKLKGSFK